MKTARFTEPIYPTTFVLLWDCSRDEAATEIIDKYDPEYEDDDDYRGLCLEAMVHEADEFGNKHFVIIVLPTWSAMSNSLLTLAHECFHATEYVMAHREIPHSKDTSEAWAYYLDYVLGQCLKHLNTP